MRTNIEVSLSSRLRALIERIRKTDELTPGNCKSLLIEAELSADDLLVWAEFDHPHKDSYGRKLAYDGGSFELMVMSWAPGDMSAIHDHGYTQWGAVKVFGRAEHAMFKKRDSILTTIDRRIFESGTVVAVAHDLIHQMGNPGPKPFLSLHLYGCDHRAGDITADARLYEPAEGCVQITSGGVFFSLPEDQITRRVDGLESDFPTVTRHRVELIKRLLRMEASSGKLIQRRKSEQEALFSEDSWRHCQSDFENRIGNSEPYLSIRSQELAAMAKLQLRLSQEQGEGYGMDSKQLSDIVAINTVEETADTYVELASKTYSIPLSCTTVVA